MQRYNMTDNMIGGMDKINIYIPTDVYDLLMYDARSFEIFKKDGNTVNLNKFLNLLILGYQSDYTDKLNEESDKIAEILSEFKLSQSDINYAADKIIREVIAPIPGKKKGTYSQKINLKPVKKTEVYVMNIIDNLNNDTSSQYFSRMIISYAGLPAYKREQIIFSSNYNDLMENIQKNRCILFSTTSNPDVVHNVRPYCITHSKEEMFNYLLCQEYSEYTHSYEARTYRLTRIQNVTTHYDRTQFDPDVLRHLKKMQKTAPQYSINSDEPVVVQMDAEGIKQYSRIYYGRPDYVSKNKLNNDIYEYTFDCSEDQAYLYFRRLDDSNYKIIQPVTLLEKLSGKTSEKDDTGKTSNS